MPRQPRLDAPGTLHHIIGRGIEKSKVFRKPEDQEDFVGRVAELCQKRALSVYGWALLDSHFHLLVRNGNQPLSQSMRRLLTGYGVGFNRRHKRRGHLLQNRYKSIVCQEEAYLQELVRYIHLNPLRAGVVPDLASLNRYPYCGHSALMGERERPWQDVGYVLQAFGKRVGNARKEYFSYVEAGVEQGRRRDLVGGGLVRSLGGWAEVEGLRLKGQEHIKSDERILGDSDFVDSVLGQAEEHYERQCALKRQGYDLEKVAERVGEIYGIKPTGVFARGRQPQRVGARSLFCYWAVRELGNTLVSLAIRLRISPAGVVYAVQRGEAIARENGYQLTK